RSDRLAPTTSTRRAPSLPRLRHPSHSAGVARNQQRLWVGVRRLSTRVWRDQRPAPSHVALVAPRFDGRSGVQGVARLMSIAAGPSTGLAGLTWRHAALEVIAVTQ